MEKYNFNKQLILDNYNGKLKVDSWSDDHTNETDAIQATFTFLQGEDLKRAHALYNLALKHVNGNSRVQAEESYAEYEERRNAFFSELGFRVSGKKLERNEEIEEEMER